MFNLKPIEMINKCIDRILNSKIKTIPTIVELSLWVLLSATIVSSYLVILSFFN